MDGIICIYKPSGYTSFDVVAVIRKLFKTRKVGHGGTLDPMAEGVLPIFLGNATRAVDFQPGDDKEYLAGFRFGFTTDTQDITGQVTSVSDEYVSRNKMIFVERKIGEIEQIPPMYSAVQVNGKRLYELARKGEEVERKPKKVTIHSLKVEHYADNEGLMRVSCSKGTYIRTLIHDIGQELGTGAVMTSLIRTKSGVFTLDDCRQLDDIRRMATREGTEGLRGLLMPTDKLFADYPKAVLDEMQTGLFCNGVKLAAARIRFDRIHKGLYAVYGNDKALLALAQIGEDCSLKVVQRFNTPEAVISIEEENGELDE
ncbi:MAG: tRNA pseudouridine(55) synthase TruB [Oscillospiraceae bacterium]|jgi:tRNA pseudouridine55 synthase|nr:tRNA pseudouridine(55) synthase TruB [Oscillospiraceae bacterium]